MDTETQKALVAIMGKLTNDEKKELNAIMANAAEANHPTVLATRRFDAAMTTAADQMAKTECLEILGAIDEKVATHGALSTADLTTLLRKLMAHMAT
jgi:hypothetical protein